MHETTLAEPMPTSAQLAKAERSLKAAAVFTVVSGLFFASGATTATDRGVRLFLDIVFLRVGDGPEALNDSHHLVDAIMGGVMVGWGVMIWLLVDRFLRSSPRDVKQLIAVSAAAWFIVDSVGSIASGGWFNVVLNVAYGALFILPLRLL